MRVISVLTRDRHGVLATLSGVLAWAGLNILGAQVFCPKGGLALDVFTVSPPPHDAEGEARIMERLGRGFEMAASGAAPKPLPGLPPARLPGGKVIIDQEASPVSTVVEVHAADRPGLLHELTETIFELGLTIDVAKVDTVGPRVIDVFYLRDRDGLKISDDAILERLNHSLMAVGSAAPARTL